MPANDQSIKPFFTTPVINKSFELGKTMVRIGIDCIGCCTFEYKWLPRPAIRFKFVSDKALVFNEFPGTSILTVPPESTKGVPVVIQSISKINEGYEYKGFLATTYIELVITSTSTECDSVLIHIPNYIGFGFSPIVFDYSEWEITTYLVDNFKDLIKQLSENDGYAITQFGILRRKDRKSFDMTQVHAILDPFRDLLSFLDSGWCAPLFPIGIRDGKIAWIIYETILPSPWMGRHRLIKSFIDYNELIDAFKRLVEIKAIDADATLRLGTAIGMYIDARHATTQTTALILAQAALELLVSLFADCRIELLEEFYKKNIEFKHADVRLRWLLENLRIPTDIPDKLTNLQAYRAKNKDLKDADGPKILTYMRNGLIHPTGKKIKRAIGLQVEEQSAIFDASTLSIEYVALIILRFLGYNGNYASLVESTIKPVPWIDVL